MVTQLLLPMADHDLAALTSAKIRAACKAVAKDMGYKAVAEIWRCEEPHVGLKLDESNRHYIKPHEMAALKRADTRGVIIAAEMEAFGYEMPERKQPTNADDVVKRLPGVLRELFAEELAELVERKLGLR